MESPSLADVPAYYQHIAGNLFQSTVHAQGAWNPGEQHMAPVGGLLARELERFQPREGMRLTRLSYDILGIIPGGEFTVECTVLRPGRTIELLQAELIANNRVAVRLTAWRMSTQDTSPVAAVEDAAMPSFTEAPLWEGKTVWPGGFIDSLQIRALPGRRDGRGQVWIHAGYDLVHEEPTSAFSTIIGLVDTANGVASRVIPMTGGYIFPNVDLSIHVLRSPIGEWLGLDTQVSFAADGVGLTSSVLHDELGPFGRAEQLLTVRPMQESV